MAPTPDDARLELLQGTLDMLILRTLQWGPRHGHGIGQNIRGDQLRALLALMVLAVALRFLTELVVTPDERYGLTPLFGGGL